MSLPRAVSCGHYSAAPESDREAWTARLVSELEATGQIAPIADPASFVPHFVGNILDLCAGSRPSDEVEPIATSVAIQALGHTSGG